MFDGFRLISVVLTDSSIPSPYFSTLTTSPLLSSILFSSPISGASKSVPVHGGEVKIGTWQSIIMVSSVLLCCVVFCPVCGNILKIYDTLIASQ